MTVEPTMDTSFMSGSLRLAAHHAVAPGPTTPTDGVVLVHGFPVRGREAPASGRTFPQLADRIAADLPVSVLAFNFRGCGRSDGNFSMAGWRDDISAAVRHLMSTGVSGVWLVGTGSGGALCIAAAAGDPDVLGVAVLGAPTDFDDWAKNPRKLLGHARDVGVITDDDFPPDTDEWVAELKEAACLRYVEEIADRPLLVLHGDADDLVPSIDARILADAHQSAELRIIAGAGHELRHDPRAVAVLIGWLARQVRRGANATNGAT